MHLLLCSGYILFITTAIIISCIKYYLCLKETRKHQTKINEFQKRKKNIIKQILLTIPDKTLLF